MTVWVVDGCSSPSDTWIVGVFSSKKKAKNHLEKHGAKQVLEEEDDYWKDISADYMIIQYEVNKE